LIRNDISGVESFASLVPKVAFVIASSSFFIVFPSYKQMLAYVRKRLEGHMGAPGSICSQRGTPARCCTEVRGYHMLCLFTLHPKNLGGNITQNCSARCVRNVHSHTTRPPPRPCLCVPAPGLRHWASQHPSDHHFFTPLFSAYLSSLRVLALRGLASQFRAATPPPLARWAARTV